MLIVNTIECVLCHEAVKLPPDINLNKCELYLPCKCGAMMDVVIMDGLIAKRILIFNKSWEKIKELHDSKQNKLLTEMKTAIRKPDTDVRITTYEQD